VTERSRESTWRDPVQALRVRADTISCILFKKEMRDVRIMGRSRLSVRMFNLWSKSTDVDEMWYSVVVEVKPRLSVTRIVQENIQILEGRTSFCLKHLSMLRIINERQENDL
jgi:hypothetical protein